MNYRLTFGEIGQASGTVELMLPSSGPARYEAVFTGAALGDGFVVVRDLELPPPRRPAIIELRGDGIWTEFTCETAHEHWSFGLEAFGLRVDDPTEDIGDRLPVGYDLEWEAPDRVHGELLVGRAVLAVSGRGSFEIT